MLICNAKQRSAKAIAVAATVAVAAAAAIAAAVTIEVELCNNTLDSLCCRVCFLFATLG